MKYIILFSFTFLLSTFAFSQQYGWTDISANMPEQGSLSDIHVIGEEVWISGGNDKVFYSPDGGDTFQIQELPPQAGNSGITSSIFMKNNQEGYVVTYSGEINKTDDGGKNWDTLHEPGGTLNSVHFPPSSSIGYACGENGKVYSFSNTDIVDISPAGIVSSLQSIYFPVDTSEGKLCGQNIIRRYFNNTWDNLQFFDNAYLYNSIFLIYNSTGWVVGSEGKIFKTTDGISWLLQTSNTTSTLNDVFFIDSLEGWASGVEVLLHTVDGGENWVENTELDLTGKTLTALWFNSPNEGYTVSNKGTLYKYTEITTGVKQEFEATHFEIFPNPAQGKFRVQSSMFKVENATIELYDLTGKKLLEKQIPAGTENAEIDVSHLKNGVYFCRLISKRYSATQKLIIQK